MNQYDPTYMPQPPRRQVPWLPILGVVTGLLVTAPCLLLVLRPAPPPPLNPTPLTLPDGSTQTASGQVTTPAPAGVHVRWKADTPEVTMIEVENRTSGTLYDVNAAATYRAAHRRSGFYTGSSLEETQRMSVKEVLPAGGSAFCALLVKKFQVERLLIRARRSPRGEMIELSYTEEISPF